SRLFLAVDLFFEGAEYRQGRVVLGSAGRRLRSDPVGQRSHLDAALRDLERRAVGDERVVVAQLWGREGEVEIAAPRRHVQHCHRREQRGVRVERQAVGLVRRAHTGGKVAQGGGEAAKVPLVAGGDDIGVV